MAPATDLLSTVPFSDTWARPVHVKSYGAVPSMIAEVLAPVSVNAPDEPSVCSPTGEQPAPEQVQFCGPPMVSDVGPVIVVPGRTFARTYLTTCGTTDGS